MARSWAKRELRTVSPIAGWRDLNSLTTGGSRLEPAVGKVPSRTGARSQSGDVVEFGAGG